MKVIRLLRGWDALCAPPRCPANPTMASLKFSLGILIRRVSGICIQSSHIGPMWSAVRMDAIGCGSSWALATHTVFQSCASAAHRKELMEPNAAAKCSCAETQMMFPILDATGSGAPKRDLLRILS